MKKLIAGLLLLCLFFIPRVSAEKETKYFHPKTNKQLLSIVVKIMNPEETSGGTGFIYRSDYNGSWVLTNLHVCSVVAQGGVMEDAKHIKYLINPRNMIGDIYHDLCAIKMQHNWGINLKLASHDIEAGDDMTVVGHPSLLPTIITKGIASEKMVIDVVDGHRPCTEEEKTSPNYGLLCMFGDIPIVIKREAQLISTLIMGGSSGSPVFDSKGNLKAVIFAGGGQLSFSFAVPWDYLKSFIDRLNAL